MAKVLAFYIKLVAKCVVKNMARVSPSENEKWTVRMSIGKKKSNLLPTKTPTRRVEIKKMPLVKKHSTEVMTQIKIDKMNKYINSCFIKQKWKETMVNFIIESRKQIDCEARNAIKMIEKWQQNTCVQFDNIKNHIVNMESQDVQSESRQQRNLRSNDNCVQVNSMARKLSLTIKGNKSASLTTVGTPKVDANCRRPTIQSPVVEAPADSSSMSDIVSKKSPPKTVTGPSMPSTFLFLRDTSM